MGKKVETGLIVVRNDIFTKIRRNIFSLFFNKEAQLLKMIEQLQRPKNEVNGKVIIPKEIKKL